VGRFGKGIIAQSSCAPPRFLDDHSAIAPTAGAGFVAETQASAFVTFAGLAELLALLPQPILQDGHRDDAFVSSGDASCPDVWANGRPATWPDVVCNSHEFLQYRCFAPPAGHTNLVEKGCDAHCAEEHRSDYGITAPDANHGEHKHDASEYASW